MSEYDDNTFSINLRLKSLKKETVQEQKKHINELLVNNYKHSLASLNLILNSKFAPLIDLEYKDGRAFEFLCIDSSESGNTEKVLSLLNFSKNNDKKIPQLSINNALLSLTSFKRNNNKIPILHLLFNQKYFPQKPDISHVNFACISNLCSEKENIFQDLLELNEIPYSEKIINILKKNKRIDLLATLEHFYLSLEIKNKNTESNPKLKI